MRQRNIKLTALALMLALGTLTSLGQWYKYPTYFDKIDNIIDTKERVYFLSGSSLYSYDYDDQEMTSYTPVNKLSDNNITSIYYNPKGNYLLIAYDNCNMDILYDDGRVANLPEIKDAPVSTGQKINYVSFGNGMFAVATTFGMVLYDDRKREVIESGIYNTDVQSIAIMGDQLLIYYRDDNGWGVFHSPLDTRHNTLDKFSPIGNGIYISEMMPLNSHKLLFKGKDSGQLFTREVHFDSDTWSSSQYLGHKNISPLTTSSKGIYASTADGIVDIDPNGKATLTPVPDEVKGQIAAYWETPTKVWVGNPEGIARYDTSSGTAVLNARMLAADAMTTSQPAYMRWSADKKRLYLSNMEASLYRSYALGEGSNDYQTTTILEDSYPRDVSLWEASASSTISKRRQEKNDNHRMYGDPNWVIEDPNDANRYYIGNNFEGVYVCQYNPQTGKYDELGKFDHSNSTIADVEGNARVLDVNIDPSGNLWAGYLGGAGYSVLPSDKRKQDPGSIKASDWVELTALSSITHAGKDMMSLFHSRGNMVFLVSGLYESGLVALNTNGTPTNPSDDKALQWKIFTDQDGVSFTPTRITFAIEDRRSAIWIGTSSGIFEISDPEAMTQSSATVRRIKVPRNDGTNYADYLLDSDQINWMCLDPGGRKWVATENSGIFLISETGDQIIRNYTTDNSPLPTNTVCSIECDPEDNTVYVGTPMGLYTFLSDSSAPRDDYSEILAYPNPVRPEFYGDVTIKGLMENSIVKISDTAGNVVYETRSQGGMATWNVCNRAGKRVPSGVYYVHAISNDGNKSHGATTKIVVIN